MKNCYTVFMILTFVALFSAGCAGRGNTEAMSEKEYEAPVQEKSMSEASDNTAPVEESPADKDAAIPVPEIEEGALEKSGISKEAVDLISDIISSDVEHGFTGAQLAVMKDGLLVYDDAWGSVNTYLPDGSKNPDKTPVTTDTLFDLASVTKMFSVNYALQKLVTDGKIDLDDRIIEYLGEAFAEDVISLRYNGGTSASNDIQKQWKSSLTIRDLLWHQGGFPPDPKYFNPCVDFSSQEYDPDSTNPLFAGNDGTAVTRIDTIDMIYKTPLMYEPGTKSLYSDVDFMILGLVVEKVTGMDLDTYLKEIFCKPLGLTHITFNPLEHGFRPQDIAATELNGNTRDGVIYFPGIRTYTLQGEVHDEKAWYSMGGVSGHAGLFANAAELARLAELMLTGSHEGAVFFSQDVIDTFTAPKDSDHTTWGLGWRRAGNGKRPSYFGSLSSPDTFGHQGWTGTLVMIDPERELVVVYLTNKINSPVSDRANDPNRFDGSYYTASTLGFVPDILCIGTDNEDVTAKLLSYFKDIAKNSVDLIPAKAPANHPAVKNAESKISLLQKLADLSGDDDCRSLAEALTASLADR